jgi:hypothetical protein
LVVELLQLLLLLLLLQSLGPLGAHPKQPSTPCCCCCCWCCQLSHMLIQRHPLLLMRLLPLLLPRLLLLLLLLLLPLQQQLLPHLPASLVGMYDPMQCLVPPDLLPAFQPDHQGTYPPCEASEICDRDLASQGCQQPQQRYNHRHPLLLPAVLLLPLLGCQRYGTAL